MIIFRTKKYWLFALLALVLGASAPAKALTIEADEEDIGPLGGFLSFYLAGPIEPGDAKLLEAELKKHQITASTRVTFTFNSPGGSVTEAMRIGRIIDSLPHGMRTNVGGKAADDLGECASACVFAFLGGHYRYANRGSLGVHQFFYSGKGVLSGVEATSISQMMAADIVDYFREMRVDSEFFSVMTSAFPDEIYWVPAEELERLRVLNGDIYDEKNEYKNSDGHFYLLMWQQSRFGENKMVVWCENDVPGFIAYLQPPEHYMNGSFDLIINGEAQEPALWNVVGDPNSDGGRWVEVRFTPKSDQLQKLKSATSIGARMVMLNGDFFFGFEKRVQDTKLRDTLNGCRPDKGAKSAQPVPVSGMIDLGGVDLPGEDLLQMGVRDVSFDECKRLCEGITSCRAVTWVASKKWCWPKGRVGAASPADGVESAIRN